MLRRCLLAVFVLGATACTVHRPPDLDQGGRPPAASWFARQRLSGGDPIPADARYRRAALPRAPGTWVPAGPTNVGGRLTSLAVDPNDRDHVWAGGAAGGVFESRDAGNTWTPVFDAQPVLNVGALATHPTSSAIVYVGLGEANGAGYSYDGDGVYRTLDGGLTWQHLGLEATRRIGRIAIDPVNPQRVFVAAAGNVYVSDTWRGVYRTLDGGTTWTNVLFVAPTAGAIDVAIDPSNPSRIYAAIWEHFSTPTQWVPSGFHSGIWRSLDGGDTWTRLGGGLPASAADVGRIGLAIARSSPQTVYALYTDDEGKPMGVYRTTDGGQSWSRRSASGARQAFGGYPGYCGQIRVDPADASVVYVLDMDWLRSTDGAQSFALSFAGYADHHDLVILPDRLYLANDGGFYRSTDLGSTWTHAPSMAVTQFYDLGIDPVDPDRRYGGSQDMGTLRTIDGGSGSWNNILASDGFQCEVDPVEHLRVYCESAHGNIRRSTNGGDTFEYGEQGINQNDRKNWNAPIVHDPRTAQRLYAGTDRVYRSVDGAAHWEPISADLTDGAPALAHASPSSSVSARRAGTEVRDHVENVAEGTVTTIAASPLSLNVVWAGTDDGNLWVTENGGASWTRVDVPGRAEWVTRVEADPFSISSAYVTYSGYHHGSPLPRIFRTLDFGATWADIGAGLPDVPLNCVNADPDPAMRGRLFVGSDLGVFVTDDYGASWSLLGAGLPSVVVPDLDLVHPSRQLFAGTHGRSMFVFDLDQLGPADADGDGTHNLADCRLDDPAVFAAPGEVAGLSFGDDRATLSWISAAPGAGSGTQHQVLRGVVGELPVGGASDACLASGITSSSIADVTVPPPGSAFWYLVRARNACGTGTYGAASHGSPRDGVACP